MWMCGSISAIFHSLFETPSESKSFMKHKKFFPFFALRNLWREKKTEIRNGANLRTRSNLHEYLKSSKCNETIISVGYTWIYVVLRKSHFYIHKTFTDDIQTTTELFKFKVEIFEGFCDDIWANDLHDTGSFGNANIFYYEHSSVYVTRTGNFC